MSNIWGENIKLSIFGESHGVAIGINIDGVPSGLKLDMDAIKQDMKRRAPGRLEISTPRKEDDDIEILSGLFKGYTTGTPLSCVIYNKDKKSRDYRHIENIFRPGHGDYTGYIKYKGFNDFRGGGHFSGRLTAPLVFAGGIAKQILKQYGVRIVSHIRSIKNRVDESFLHMDIENNVIEELNQMEIPVINKKMEGLFRKEILNAKEQGDSVGGQIEVAIINCPVGLGNPFFESVESKIGSLSFSIPGVKSIEFGKGSDITKHMGSEVKDEYFIDEGKVRTRTNNNGGVLGGITNGMPIVFTVGIKPTPTILKEQETIDKRDNKSVRINIKGRHDPCIVPRALPVMESVAALAILDCLLKGDVDCGRFEEI